ncbi:MAG: sulfotransferase [Chloroflexi bacterium]|nr:sulfotransferase [Chloroflexota bacterium]
MPDSLSRFKLAYQAFLKGRAPALGRRRPVPAVAAQDVADARAFFPLEKFFIFGHARSGTTLLNRLARLHPQVHCNYQAHFFTRAPLLESLAAGEEVGAWLARKSNRWNQGRDLSPLVLRAVSDFILERDARLAGKGGPGCVVGDKSPNSLLDGDAVRQMVKVYPDARLVFIVRDGRDAALSHRFQAFIDRPQHLNRADLRIREDFIRDPSPYLAGRRSVFTEKGLRQAAAGWVHNVAETHAAALELLPGQYHALRYEDLLARPWETMEKLWAFLGVATGVDGLRQALQAEMAANPDADWQQEKAGDIASALTKGKRGSWRELFTPRDAALFEQVAGETLRAWGYEVERA